MSGKGIRNWLLILAIGLAAGIGLVPGNSSALTLDLTQGASGTINDAIFSTLTSSHPTGTGVFMPFLRTGRGNAYPIDQGYNTDARINNGQLDLNQYTDPNWTRSLLLSDLAPVTMNSTTYYAFELDFDQQANTNQNRNLLSLDKMEIYQLGSPDVLGLSNVQAGYPVYSLDDGGNNSITLDYLLYGSGQGTSDMFAFIPTSLFDSTQGDYVYLYTLFGENYPNNAGFQEWRALEAAAPVPEPATILLLGFGLLGLALLKKRPTQE